MEHDKNRGKRSVSNPVFMVTVGGVEVRVSYGGKEE